MMSKRATHFLRSVRGATAIEYAILACFVMLAIVAAVGLLGQNVQTTYAKVSGIF